MTFRSIARTLTCSFLRAAKPEDRLFAEEMAHSTRRYEDAVRLARREHTELVAGEAQAVRTRYRTLIAAAAALRLHCRVTREQSVALRLAINSAAGR